MLFNQARHLSCGKKREKCVVDINHTSVSIGSADMWKQALLRYKKSHSISK
jgi:hypothetical protein